MTDWLEQRHAHGGRSDVDQTLIRAAHFGAALRLSADHRPSFVQCPRSVREMDRPTGFPIGLKFFFDEVDEVHGSAALGCG